MDQFDREDTSTYVNRQQPSSPASAPPQPLQKAPKPRRSKAPLVLTLLLLVALAAAGGLGWLWQQEFANAQSFRYDEKAQKQEITQLKAELTELKASAKPSEENDVAVTDKDMLIETAKAYVGAEVNGNPTTAKITVAKIELPFARVDVSGTVGGAACIYKKSGDLWLWLYCAQADSEHTLMMNSIYGVPKSLTQS